MRDRNIMRSLTVILFCLASASASAACVRPGAVPVVPNGQTADEPALLAARGTIQAYVNELEAYGACLSKQAEQADNDTPVEQKVTWLAQGDAALDAAQVLANAFSASLKTFKERSSSATKP